VDAVLDDYETAPIDEKLRGALHFLATLDPGRARAADVQAGFEMITRFADAIGAVPHSEHGLSREQAMAHEGRFFDEGYA
jgi:hypothetical protein